MFVGNSLSLCVLCVWRLAVCIRILSLVSVFVLPVLVMLFYPTTGPDLGDQHLSFCHFRTFDFVSESGIHYYYRAHHCYFVSGDDFTHACAAVSARSVRCMATRTCRDNPT